MVAYIDPDIYLYVIPFMINKDPVRKKSISKWNRRVKEPMCKKGMWCVFKLGLSYAGKCNQTVIEIKKKELSLKLNSLMLNSRDDKIRTCDHTPPRRVLYRAELHPELRMQKYGLIFK